MTQSDHQTGSTILNVLVGIVIMSGLSLAYVNLYASVRKVQSKIDFLNAVSQIHLTIHNTVNDANSWKSTISDTIHNGSMSCIATQTCTSAVPPTGFVVWPASEASYSNLGQSVYNGTSLSAGFTTTGKSCSTFSLSGNPDCPIHVNLAWSTAGCTPAPCQAPITVTADILYRPGPSMPVQNVNESQYTLSFTQISNTANDPCAGSVSPTEANLCASPPYPEDTLVCTASGYRCGQVYR